VQAEVARGALLVALLVADLAAEAAEEDLAAILAQLLPPVFQEFGQVQAQPLFVPGLCGWAEAAQMQPKRRASQGAAQL